MVAMSTQSLHGVEKRRERERERREREREGGERGRRERERRREKETVDMRSVNKRNSQWFSPQMGTAPDCSCPVHLRQGSLLTIPK